MLEIQKETTFEHYKKEWLFYGSNAFIQRPNAQLLEILDKWVICLTVRMPLCVVQRSNAHRLEKRRKICHTGVAFEC